MAVCTLFVGSKKGVTANKPANKKHERSFIGFCFMSHRFVTSLIAVSLLWALLGALHADRLLLYRNLKIN